MAADDLEYYEGRARHEAAAAAAEDRVEIASAHRLLALQYEDQVRELRESQKHSETASLRKGETGRLILKVL